MRTFAERLKIAIDKRNLSQAEAARRCGISQQSMNYIINSNLDSSKLAIQIAAGLEINPDWLIYGRGRFEEIKIYELPLIHSSYMLKKFLNKDVEGISMNYTPIDTYLGEQAFAYLWEAKKLAICAEKETAIKSGQYLTLQNSNIILTDSKEEISFPIFEWRTRYVEF